MVQFTQTRSAWNFTENGFAVVQAPQDLVGRLQATLHKGLAHARKESGKPMQGIYGTIVPEFVPHTEVRRQLCV
jgi:hypothetical protein